MQIQLYTSLTGLKNRIEGRRMIAFTEESIMRNEIDNIVVLIDEKEIVHVDESGMVVLEGSQDKNDSQVE